jgi:hypothetical protein
VQSGGDFVLLQVPDNEFKDELISTPSTSLVREHENLPSVLAPKALTEELAEPEQQESGVSIAKDKDMPEVAASGFEAALQLSGSQQSIKKHTEQLLSTADPIHQV